MVVTQHEPAASPRLHIRPDPRRARNPTCMQPLSLLYSSPYLQKKMKKQNMDHSGGSLGHLVETQVPPPFPR